MICRRHRSSSCLPASLRQHTVHQLLLRSNCRRRPLANQETIGRCRPGADDTDPSTQATPTKRRRRTGNDDTGPSTRMPTKTAKQSKTKASQATNSRRADTAADTDAIGTTRAARNEKKSCSLSAFAICVPAVAVLLRNGQVDNVIASRVALVAPLLVSVKLLLLGHDVFLSFDCTVDHFDQH